MKIKQLRIEKGITQSELGRFIGVERSTICQYEKGTRMPDNLTLIKIADYFGVSIDYLLERTEIKTPPDIQGAIDVGELEMYPIPLLGRVVAGVPLESQENLEGYVFINHKPKEEYFALKVFGDSMINAGIPDGAILIVHKQSHAENF